MDQMFEGRPEVFLGSIEYGQPDQFGVQFCKLGRQLFSGITHVRRTVA